MDVSRFKNGRLVEIVEEAKLKCKGKAFSDIKDDEGNQYVDLVMEGGGMLGIAHVGYIYVLEQVGIRFLGLGGASAGSINALLLAALGEPAKAKGEILLKELANAPFVEFLDDSDARDLIMGWIKKKSGWVRRLFKGVQLIDNIWKDLGLNSGDVFRKWLSEILKREGVETYAKLKARMETLPKGLRVETKEERKPLDLKEAKCRLAILAADISTETKVEFPEMACLYWKDCEQIDPADFVRASMSIPGVFRPFRVKNLPQGEDLPKKWKDLAGFRTDEEGGIPKEAVFIDGGVMSNFPIDLFHDHEKIPCAPTFGVKLELDSRLQKVDSPLALLFAIFNSARHTLDYDFIHRNADYERLVTWIPAKGFNWLDFSMGDGDKIKLFEEGAHYAAKFLAEFEWDKYKGIRSGRLRPRYERGSQASPSLDNVPEDIKV